MHRDGLYVIPSDLSSAVASASPCLVVSPGFMVRQRHAAPADPYGFAKGPRSRIKLSFSRSQTYRVITNWVELSNIISVYPSAVWGFPSIFLIFFTKRSMMAGKSIPVAIGILAFFTIALSIADIALLGYANDQLDDRRNSGAVWPLAPNTANTYSTVPFVPTWLLVLRVNATIIVTAAFALVAGLCCLISTGPLIKNVRHQPQRMVWPTICLATSGVAMVITLAIFIYVFYEQYTSLQLVTNDGDLGTYLYNLQIEYRRYRNRSTNHAHMTAEAYTCQLAPAYSPDFSGVYGHQLADPWWSRTCRTLKAGRWIMLPNLLFLIGLVLSSSVLVARIFSSSRKQGTTDKAKESHKEISQAA
nr:hypothetical protein CFP56_19635 [Quercus suber]